MTYLKKTFISLLMCLVLIGLGACGSDEITPSPKPADSASHLKYNIMVVYSTGGLGDMGFSDEIYDGICQWETETGDSIHLSQFIPENREDAAWWIDLILNPEFLETDSHTRNLLILADGTYGELLAASDAWKNSSTWDVLLLDAPTTLPKELQQSSLATLQDNNEGKGGHVYAPTFSYYGAAYLAALLHYQSEYDIYGGDDEDDEEIDFPFQPSVVMANDKDEAILNTLQGLRDGYAVNHHEMPDSCIAYLAHNPGEGYDKADDAFNQTYDLWKKGATMMYPLCGGSAVGLYRFARMEHMHIEVGGYLFTFCGIDADMTYTSYRCSVSLKKNLSEYIQYFSNLWMNQPSALVHHEIYGLDSPYISVTTLNKHDKMEQMKEQAVEAEKKFLVVKSS